MSTPNLDSVNKICVSRNNLLEIMQTNGFDTSSYKQTSIDELYNLINTNNLDMILESPTKDKKIYICYYITDTLSVSVLHGIVDKLFDNTQELNAATDTLYMVVNINTSSSGYITDALKMALQTIWVERGINVILEELVRLQFNILRHVLVAKHTILDANAETAITARYAKKDMPKLTRFDPVARAICARPGQIIHTLRPSETAILSDYYRICTNE